MSVQNESLDMKKSSEHKLSAPELEYKAASQDSLSMFFAAIGGAVLGTLATLLVLAIINGGTLNFTRPERLAVMEANLTRVSENVGTVSQNLDIVASQVTEMRDQLASARSELDAAAAKLQDQDSALTNLRNAVAGLAVTGERFDVLVAALDQALISMRKIEGSTVAKTPTRAIAAPSIIVNDASVPAGAIAVLFFVDHNSNGVMDADEVNLTGITMRVTTADGTLVGEFVSDDAGVMVENLKPGAYTISLVDTAGHATLSEEIEVTVKADASEGQILYVPMAR